jgi:hypothetical protein
MRLWPNQEIDDVEQNHTFHLHNYKSNHRILERTASWPPVLHSYRRQSMLPWQLGARNPVLPTIGEREYTRGESQETGDIHDGWKPFPLQLR